MTLEFVYFNINLNVRNQVKERADKGMLGLAKLQHTKRGTLLQKPGGNRAIVLPAER